MADNQTKQTTFVYVLAALSAVGGFLFGYDTGVVSGAMILIRDNFRLDYFWQQLIVSITIASAWLSSLCASLATERLGRRWTILAASLIFTAGSVIMGVANTKEVLLGGRLVVGVAIGFASMAVPMYIGEVSPAEIRGKLVTLNNCCITMGQAVASIVDGIFSSDLLNGWRYMLGLAAVPAIIQFIGFLFLPESPRWLADRGNFTEAERVLRKVRVHEEDVQREMEDMRACKLQQDEAPRGSKFVFLDILKKKTLRRALIIGCSLQLFQQIVGINTVMYYSATIIEMAGIGGGDKSKIIWLSVIPATVNFFASLSGIYLVERLGRRKLTLFSLSGVIFSLCVLSLGFVAMRYSTPAVTAASDKIPAGVCTGMRTCYDCTQSSSCGFCFSGSAGSCEAVSPKFPDHSKAGFCGSNSTITRGRSYTWAKEWCPTPYGILALVGLLLYLMTFSPGMGPTPWTINAEIYPQWARGTCTSIATSCNWCANFLISMTFLYLTQALTKQGAFGFYAVLGVLAWVIFYFFLPETRGVSLEQVDALFTTFWFQRTSEEKKELEQKRSEPGTNIPVFH